MVSDWSEPEPGVRWFEAPSDAQLATLYAEARVLCLPSSYEGFGIPYIEAMAYGTPPVATSNFGAEMVLSGGRDGVIAPLTTIGLELVDLLTDDERWKGLSDRARLRVRDFSWNACIAAHMRAYQHAIDSHG
jgi:glycosyltransferase involved in cell wall biosynthesis